MTDTRTAPAGGPTRYFTAVDTKRGYEVARYEVSDGSGGWIGDVYTLTSSKGSPSRRLWFAELEGEVVGTAKTRAAAARILGPERPPKQRTILVPPKKDDEDWTFQIVQPVLFFDGGTMVTGSGERPSAKADRRKAAYNLLTDYGATLHVMGITAKVSKDGFIYLSPAALEKLLKVARAMTPKQRKQVTA